MNQAQLLALETILPTILGVVGLVFIVLALVPLGGPGVRAYAGRSAGFGIAGVACVAVGVALWLNVVGLAAQVGSAAPAPSTKPSASASATASASSIASKPAAASSSAVASVSAASPSAAPSTPASAVPTVISTPTIPAGLTPIAPVAFQPENTPAHAAIVGVQSFEHGVMLYRDDLKQIYVMTLDQKFKVYPDTWKEAQNPDLAAGPINAKFYPGRGFGWLWASNPDVRQALGVGVTQEAGFTGSMRGDGSTTTISADVTYAFNKDGTWALK